MEQSAQQPLYDEWARLNKHPLERDVTQAYFDRYITKPKRQVLDLGGGPGRYAVYLAGKGHAVTLYDEQQGYLNQGQERAEEQGVELATVQGDARDTSALDKEYDVVLLQRVLYHYTEEGDRNKVVQNAVNLLKPGGLLFATFASAYAPPLQYLQRPENLQNPHGALRFLEDGANPGAPPPTPRYFCTPEKAKKLMADYPLKQLAFAGLENLVGTAESQLVGRDPQVYATWLQVALALAEDTHLLGTSRRMLYVGRRKTLGFLHMA